MQQFYTFYPKITSPLGGWGVMKCIISCLLTLQMLYIPNLVKIGPVVIEKKTHDGQHQPIAIGHLSDSVDLKRCAVLHFCIPSGWKSLQACMYVYLFNCHENLQICMLYGTYHLTIFRSPFLGIIWSKYGSI